MVSLKNILSLCALLLPLLVPAQKRSDIESIRRSKASKQVLVACHRGGDWHNFPENSLESIRSAINIGADFVEIDVRKTRDGKLILMHDRSLERTTTGTGLVKDKTYQEICLLRLRDKHKNETPYLIPTLEEALMLMKDKVFIKVDKYNEENIRNEIVEVLKRTGTLRQASFRVGLDYEKTVKNYGDLTRLLHLFPAIQDSDTVKARTGAEIANFQRSLKPVVFQAKFKDSTSAVVQSITDLNQAGEHIWVMASRDYYCGGWGDKISLTAPDKGWGKLIEKGVTIIETDYPQQLLAYLKKYKSKNQKD
ncbi:glycerophosphodiester phosphodiesterase family protein [Pedobacter sp. SYSU D00535]|uniref:glycerophosphodiester phosphodiesterase family protein n=1 Tax=Pedobacter sp. SYSU D00535 TaxID=2810308 RepID=UPI001A97A16F|nr:glycerophosphodiester phosphodiesterase family protein [Pedobacter sp. SYSU D00535]